MKKIGVYLIRNLINQKLYIGSSTTISKKWSKHRVRLNTLKHENSYIQEDWIKHGKNNFDFSIQELCNESDLLTRETYWVNFYDTMNPDKGYNYCLPNDQKIHRKPRERKGTNITVCINIKTKEARELTIFQIRESLDIKNKEVYKGLGYWSGKKGSKRSIRGWMFIRKREYDPNFDYIGHDKLKVFRENYILKPKKEIVLKTKVEKNIKRCKILLKEISSGKELTFDSITEAIEQLGLNKKRTYICLSTVFGSHSHKGYYIRKL